MPITYTKKQYEKKLNAIKANYEQLKNHLVKMEELEKEIPRFWKDDHARETAQVLNAQITRVKYAMQRTEDMINFYQKSIDQLSSLGGVMSDELKEALSIVSKVGTPGK